MNNAQLKDYMMRVKELEIRCYQQKELYNRANAMYQRAQKPAYYEYKRMPVRDTAGIVNNALGCAAIFGIPGGVIIGVIISGFFSLPLFKSMIICAIVCFIGIAIFFCVSDFKDFDKRAARTYYEIQNAREQNLIIESRSKKQRQLAFNEMNRIQNALSQTCQVLDEYYRKGVIYPKYQHDLVAIAMFCEYLNSNRCSSLEGEHGAYNKFEDEKLHREILSKLDDVINKLDQVCDNQMMLVNDLRRCNQQINQISGEMESSLYRLEQIDSNLEVGNYFNEITALNTTYMAWLKRW